MDHFLGERTTGGLVPEVVADMQGSLEGKGRNKQSKESSVDNSSFSHCVRKEIVHKDDHEEENFAGLEETSTVSRTRTRTRSAVTTL